MHSQNFFAGIQTLVGYGYHARVDDQVEEKCVFRSAFLPCLVMVWSFATCDREWTFIYMIVTRQHDLETNGKLMKELKRKRFNLKALDRTLIKVGFLGN